MEIIKSVLRKIHGVEKVPVSSIADYELNRVDLPYASVREAKIAFFKTLSEKQEIWDLDRYSSILYRYEALVKEATATLQPDEAVA
jgi:hypothetical protein